MKKQLITLMVLFLSSLNTFSQEQKKIIYIFSDIVESAIDSNIKKIERNNKGDHFYLILEVNNSLYSLYIGRYNPNETGNPAKLANATNRFALINNNYVPLIFDYDFLFGTDNNNDIGVFHHRDGEISRSMLILEEKPINFDKKGKLVTIYNK